MAQKTDGIFLVIKAKASDFLSIGLGYSDDIVTEQVTISGVKFSQTTVKGGKWMMCDDCSIEIEPSDDCYYVSVLNRILCPTCFSKWVARAKYYSEDKPYEERNYNIIKAQLNDAGLWQE